MMSADQSVIYLLCGVMALHSITSRQKFSYEIFKDYDIQNKIFYRIEKILMVCLPLVVMVLGTVLSLHAFVIRLWMILIVLLDFALQSFAKECGWIECHEDKKISSMIIIWIVFMIAVFFTVKS